MAMSRGRKIVNGVVGIIAGIAVLVYWARASGWLSKVPHDQRASNEVTYVLIIGIVLLGAGTAYLILGLTHKDSKPPGPGA